MTDKKIHLGLGITDTIYAGKVRKLKNGAQVWSGEKHDVTDDFYSVLIQLVARSGKGFSFKTTKGNEIIVKMQE